VKVTKFRLERMSPTHGGYADCVRSPIIQMKNLFLALGVRSPAAPRVSLGSDLACRRLWIVDPAYAMRFIPNLNRANAGILSHDEMRGNDHRPKLVLRLNRIHFDNHVRTIQ